MGASIGENRAEVEYTSLVSLMWPYDMNTLVLVE